jgi:hypothetical protein
MTELAGKIIGRTSDYSGLIALLRQRQAELGVTMESLDQVAGLPSRYAAKLLSPVPVRSLGRISLGPLLQSLGLQIVLIEDQSALDKVRPRFGTRERKMMRSGGTQVVTIRISRRKLAMLAKRGGRARAQRLTAEQRSESARHAARARWSKHKEGGARPLGSAQAKVEAKA